MITLVVHLTARPNCLEALRIYEAKALAVFRQCGGEVIAAFQPEPNGDGRSQPDEIHILRMETRKAFNDFLQNPSRLALAEEGKAALLESRVYFSSQEIPY